MTQSPIITPNASQVLAHVRQAARKGIDTQELTAALSEARLLDVTSQSSMEAFFNLLSQLESDKAIAVVTLIDPATSYEIDYYVIPCLSDFSLTC